MNNAVIGQAQAYLRVNRMVCVKTPNPIAEPRSKGRRYH